MKTYTLSKEESRRLDFLKCIATIFVVFIHGYSKELNYSNGADAPAFPNWLFISENFVSGTLAQCAVPLFFLISSILLFMKKRNYKTTISKKVKSLILPYFIWNALWFAADVLLQNVSFAADYFPINDTPVSQSSFSDLLAMFGIGTALPYPLDAPLWFVRDLFSVMLIFPIIEKIADKFPKIFTAATVALIILPVSFPFKVALQWFCLGACFVKLNIHLTIFDNVAMWNFFAVYILSALAAVAVNNDTVNTLFIFVGIIFWARFTKCIFDYTVTQKLFSRLSEYTFIIYAAHAWIISSLQKICAKFVPIQPITLFAQYILLPILVIALCVLSGVIFKKFTPKIYSLCTGAR